MKKAGLKPGFGNASLKVFNRINRHRGPARKVLKASLQAGTAARLPPIGGQASLALEDHLSVVALTCRACARVASLRQRGARAWVCLRRGNSVAIRCCQQRRRQPAAVGLHYLQHPVDLGLTERGVDHELGR